MARIGLCFRTRRVLHPRFGDEAVRIIRLMAKARFRGADGEPTDSWDAVLDTGAPFGVLPRRVWIGLEAEVRVPRTELGGLSRRKICQIGASFATVHGQLEDETGARSEWYGFPASLARTDRVPLILGFAGLMEKMPTHFDYSANEAWVEERLPLQP